MRTPRQPRPTPYLNRRDQFRTLALVALLCLVMVAIQFAARPASWHWLLPPQQDAATNTDGAHPVRLEELDFRVRDAARQPLPPDVFRTVAAVDSDPEAEADAPAAGRDSAAAPVRVEIPAERLAPIEDNTVGVRRSEAAAFYEMLDRVRRLPDEVVAARADNDVAFTVIMLQSADYRGKLIGVRGRLRRLAEYPATENEQGINRIYDGWLFTDDSGNNPWRFLCTQLPAGVVANGNLEPLEIHVSGYFFKRAGYASQGGMHVAPTLLCDSFEVLPAPVNAGPQMQSALRTWLLSFVGAVIVVLGVTIWRFAVSDQRYARSRLSELAAARLDADSSDLDALERVEPVEAAELFANDNSADNAGAES